LKAHYDRPHQGIELKDGKGDEKRGHKDVWHPIAWLGKELRDFGAVLALR
jgi:hypothetical protein